MTVMCYDHGPFSNKRVYATNLTNIRDVAQEYGRTEDTVELYDNEMNLIAIASWPFGGKVYMYCEGKFLDAENQSNCIFVY